MKLHLGSGMDIREGWINIDGYCVDEKIVNHDLRRGLPAYKENSIEFIFSQHFIEHIKKPEALTLFTDCYKKLKPGGVMRIVVPDLDECIRRYLENDLNFGGAHSYAPKSKCDMLNDAFHEWGHQYMYNRDELIKVLSESGFRDFSFPDWKQSTHKELSDMDTRPRSDLRVEAVKSGTHTDEAGQSGTSHTDTDLTAHCA